MTNKKRPRVTRRRPDPTTARFVILTFVGIVALFSLSRVPLFSKSFVYPYTRFVTSTSRAVLRLIGVDVGGQGLVIASSSFGVEILNICNGLEVTAIFVAVVLAFPTSWRRKLVGLLMGCPAIFAINIVRIVVLFLLGFKIPGVFESAHRYYAQAFVIVATLVVWLLWVTRFTEYGSKTRHRVSP